MTGQRKAQRRALIVANDTYEHDGLGRLVSPAADADALAKVLGDAEVGGFDVDVVRNEPAHVIQLHIEDLLSEGRPNDLLLLHFSCHGLKSESGELYFAAPNTLPHRLGSTAVSADFVQRCIDSSWSQQIVLLLDCCYGGAFSRGVTVRASGDANVLDSFPGGQLGGGHGRAVITASSAIEYAFEGDRLAEDHSPRASVFTGALVEGLSTGDADNDEDGFVSLDELYAYVYDKVRERNPNQTPSRDFQLRGDLHIAKSRRRRVRGQPIPPDLQAASVDQNLFTRLGAVSELRSRLLADNLPAAVGAHEALARIADTDIQYVANAASAALAEADLQISEHALRFGPAPRNTRPDRQRVQLLGPPIARTCTIRTSASWIHVVEVAGGLDISVDTSEIGARRGEVAVSSPAGTTVIVVELEVTAPDDMPPSPTEPSPALAQARSGYEQARSRAERVVESSERHVADVDAIQAGASADHDEPEPAGFRVIGWFITVLIATLTVIVVTLVLAR